MLEKFKRLCRLTDGLRATSSSAKKISMLKEYRDGGDPEFDREVFGMVFGKDVLFHLKSESVMSCRLSYGGILDKDRLDDEAVLDHLRKVASKNGSDAEAAWCRSVHDALEEMDAGVAGLYLNIIDKDLKCGVSAGLFKKVYPELAGKFQVALADKYFGGMEDKVDFEKDVWYASRKMDGCRCLAIIDGDGKCTFMSRQGKEFDTLWVLKKEIESFGLTDTVLDGECCIVDENGDEHFDWIMKEIKRKNHTIQNPMYQVFDMLTTDEFYGVAESPDTAGRYCRLDDFFESHDTVHLRNVRQVRVVDRRHFDRLFSEALSRGWEGLIIRKNVPYEGKRTKNMLKCKSFNDAEYEVVGCETGPMRFVEDGRQVELDVLTSVDIIHKGCRVQVGSGFSKEQRLRYRDYPDLIIGATITVKYFEETKNQDGGVSLRFPTVKAVYENGREV